MEFTLTIHLGDDTIKRGKQLANALEEVAHDMRGINRFTEPESGDIRNADKTEVGRWAITPAAAKA
jgi:hypothetical protein